MEVGNYPHTARVVRTIDIPGDSSQYATLSHRWGSSGPKLQLTSSNETLLHGGIELESHPRLFREACMLTFRLGVQYLWIDCLCILNDDKAERDEECEHMDSIYAGSIICIAASDAIDSEDSMYKAYHPLGSVPCWMGTSRRMKNPFLSVAVRPHRESAGLRYVNSRPLNQRGWVMQERLLARRTLHMTSYGAYWECNRVLASDRDRTTSVGGTTMSSTKPTQANELKTFFSQSPQKGVRPQPPSRALMYWMEAIDLYTRACLTYRSDTVQALRGLSKRMSEITGGNLGENVAGLWKYRLETQLAWAVEGSNSCRMARDNSSCYAPSWSWASVNRQTSLAVAFQALEYPEHVVLLATSDRLESGSVDSGGSIAFSSVLTMTGWLWKLSKLPLGVSERRIIYRVHCDRHARDCTVEDHAHECSYFILPLFLSDARASYESCFFDKVHQAWLGDGQSRGPQVLRAVFGYPSYSLCTHIYFLILEHTITSNGRFRRVGLLSVGVFDSNFFSGTHGTTNRNKLLEQDFQEIREYIDPSPLTEEFYVSYAPHTGRCVIEIE